MSDAYQRLVAEIDQAAIEKAGDECWRQFISHPPKRSDYVGGFIVGAMWMLAEKADAIAERDRLREACEAMEQVRVDQDTIGEDWPELLQAWEGIRAVLEEITS